MQQPNELSAALLLCIALTTSVDGYKVAGAEFWALSLLCWCWLKQRSWLYNGLVSSVSLCGVQRYLCIE